MFMKMNFFGCSAAPTPLGESTTSANRCSAVVSSSSTAGVSGLIHTSAAAPSGVIWRRQVTVSRYPGAPTQLCGTSAGSPSISGGCRSVVTSLVSLAASSQALTLATARHLPSGLDAPSPRLRARCGNRAAPTQTRTRTVATGIAPRMSSVRRPTRSSEPAMP